MANEQVATASAQLVTVQKEGHVAIVRLNRPKALNALNQALIADLRRVISELEADASVAGIVLTGSGERAFAAGADIAEMQDMAPPAAHAMARAGQRVLDQIENLSKPVVAAVRGYALGGGCELAMACDWIVAGASARFGQPEASIGVTTGFAGSQRLSRLVGKARAKELVMTGRQIDAQEALGIGLAVRVVPDEEVLSVAQGMIEAVAKNAPVAVRLSKETINRGANMDLDAASEMEADAFAVCFSTEDQKEGMKAFLGKRKPVWKGS